MEDIDMKARIKIKIEKEYEVKYLQVNAGVRYWEDSTINRVKDDCSVPQMPCVVKKEMELRWMPLIDLDDGRIVNWKEGITANIHYKVCDDGEYELLDDEKNPLFTIESYVPSVLYPSECGFGDYIIMHVDENGYIKYWHCGEDDIQELIDNAF